MRAEGKERLLRFGSRRIPYRLYRTVRKGVRIVVSHDLAVRVFAPKKIREDEADTVVRKKAPWIARTLDKLAACQPLPALKRYVDGESFVFLGEPYRLKILPGPDRPAEISGSFLVVQVKDVSQSGRVRRVVDGWYRARARETFAMSLSKCRPTASLHGIPEPSLTLRNMRRRWGSCSRSGRLNLNVRLVQTPLPCIEFVVMHELCHLVHHHHGRRFYSLLTLCLPDWRERKAVLNRFRLC